jgi:ABC-2 type transport system ATP-binding protein
MSENIIEVKNLVRKFDDLTAVNDISFSVKRGEIFAFLGPNGAGKTTTIKMLTTLLSPTSGEVFLGGHNVTENPAQTDDHLVLFFRIQVWTMN